MIEGQFTFKIAGERIGALDVDLSVYFSFVRKFIVNV